MAENTNRSVFGLNGITGMLIATVLLLSILGGLTVWNIGVQQDNATKFYSVDTEKLKFKSTDNADLYKLQEKK